MENRQQTAAAVAAGHLTAAVAAGHLNAHSVAGHFGSQKQLVQQKMMEGFGRLQKHQANPQPLENTHIAK